MSSPPRTGVPITLVTELYPPAIGGSAVLFHEVYSRITSPPVRVITSTAGVQSADRVAVTNCSAAPYWGVARTRGISHHLGLARLLHAQEPTQVVHSARALPEGVSAWLAALRYRLPYVCWAHGEDLTMAQQSREFCWLTTRVCRNASAMLANSLSTARLLREFGVPADRLHVVHPGVDARRFSPAIDGNPIRQQYAANGEFLLLSVGRLQRRKGHDMVLRAMAVLRDGGIHVRYLIASSGDQRSTLEALAVSLGIRDRVVFLGDIETDHLPFFYAACDLFVMPNRLDEHDIEGFGIVFLEAAASGRPAIGGNTGGVPEAVEEGVTGLLVSGTDPRELARAIRLLYDSPDLRQRFGAAARRRVLESFTWEEAARAVEEVHQRVAS